MWMAIAGATAVGRGSGSNVFSLYNARRGGAYSEGHARTIGVHSRCGVLVLLARADGERSAGTVVGSTRCGAMVLADVLVGSADSENQANPVGRLGGRCELDLALATNSKPCALPGGQRRRSR